MKKRLLSLLLAFVMGVGMAVPAFAAEQSVEVNGVTYDRVLRALMDQTETAVTMKLNSDIQMDGSSVVLGSSDYNGMFGGMVITVIPTDITLDLNGYTMTGDQEFPVFEVQAGYKLTIIDSSEAKSGQVISHTEEVVAVKDGGTYIPLSGTVQSPEQSDEDDDEPVEQPSEWAAELLNKAVRMGLVPAELQGKYTQPITRAEFCALAAAAYEKMKGEVAERVEFTDTDDINVEKMAALGVVSGVGDGRFLPDSSLTREQAAVILTQLSKQLDNALAEKAADFTDSADISEWAQKAVGQVQHAGIMSGGADGRFLPRDTYTREQSIITILRVLEAAE